MPIRMFNQKTDDRWLSSISFFWMSAAENPGSLKECAKPVKTMIIPIRPKSAGVSNLAKNIVIMNCNPIFKTLEAAFHAIPDKVFSRENIHSLFAIQ